MRKFLWFVILCIFVSAFFYGLAELNYEEEASPTGCTNYVELDCGADSPRPWRPSIGEINGK